MNPKIKPTTSTIGSMTSPRPNCQWRETEVFEFNKSFFFYDDKNIGFGWMCVCDVCPLRHWEMCPVQQISIISYMTHLQSLLPLHSLSLSHTHTHVLYPLFFFFCILHPWNWTGVYRFTFRVQWSSATLNDAVTLYAFLVMFMKNTQTYKILPFSHNKWSHYLSFNNF